MMPRPDARPLYAQVQDILVGRIHDGDWKPGQLLPSETRLASELGVSQGTVRKALDALVNASLVERKQGRGTFVVEHSSARVLFKFFQIHDADGERVLPQSDKARLRVRNASNEIARSLSIAAGEQVLEISRIRTHKERPFMVETVFLPRRLFPDLHRQEALPNTLYDMFQRNYGITISRVQEDSSAVLPTRGQARALAITPETPLLKIDRIAFDIENMPVERRISYCATNGLKYRAWLR